VEHKSAADKNLTSSNKRSPAQNTEMQIISGLLTCFVCGELSCLTFSSFRKVDLDKFFYLIKKVLEVSSPKINQLRHTMLVS